MISVPTPLKDGAPDLSYIEEASRHLARFLRPGATVVLESSTYPGTTEEIVCPILEDGSGLTAGEDFYLGYSPERIDPGNTTWTLVNTPKIVSGVDAASLCRIDRFYRRLVKRTVPVSRPAEAELAKLLENTFRHVNIALVNETAMFAHELGIDIWDALDAAATKPFGYMRFNPGPGVGGHCLPVDPSYLSWRVRYTLGRPSRFIELANDINTSMPNYVVNRLVLALEPAVAVGQGPQHPAPRAVVQEEHCRCSRVPGAGGRQPAGRPRRTGHRRGPLPRGGGRSCGGRAGRPHRRRAGPGGRHRAARRSRPVRPGCDLETRPIRPRLPPGSQRSQRGGVVITQLHRPRQEAGAMRTTYCGHASFRMTRGGVSVLTDPWMSTTGAFLGSWCQFPDISGLDLDVLRHSDFVLISHDHQDHFDLGFLRTLSPATAVVVPRYRHSGLAETLRRELPNRVITIGDRESFDLGQGISVTPVLQSVPIWDDCAFIIQSPTETILDLNDLKLPEADLAWVARNFEIDYLLLQYSGANWHPHVYDYTEAKKRALARAKIFTKYRNVANVVHALDPEIVVPCAGPACFLDDELFDLNFSEHSIFVGADDFYRFAESQGFGERVRVLMPGDDLVRGPQGQDLTAHNLQHPAYANRREYLEAYRDRRRPALERHLASIADPEGPLLARFVDHFRPLVLANRWLAERIGGGVLIETTGPDAEEILVDFGDRAAPVRRYAGEPWIYRIRSERRFLNEILEHRLRWEELLLSMRVELSRVPDVYNEPLMVFLRFADARQYAAFESYETTRVAEDRFLLEHGERLLMVQRTCPHAGGDLSKGRIEDDCIVCPVHGWRYSLLDGSSSHRGYSISVTEESDEHAATA